MKIPAILSELETLGYQFQVAGDKLKCRGERPPPAEIWQALRERKAEAIRILKERETARLAFDEMTGYLAGLSKVERQAYDEWFETMIGEPFRMSRDEAHRKTRELLDGAIKFLETNPHLRADPEREP